jgi:hypothetical protein
MCASQRFHYAPQSNCRFNADANTGHAFGIFMASVGALRLRLRRRLTLALGLLMQLISYFAAALLFGACIYALYVCARILFSNDFSQIKDEDGSTLAMQHLGKNKFAVLYGVFGASGIALLLLDFLSQAPLSRWELIVAGFATSFSGARWFVIRSHKKSTSEAC